MIPEFVVALVALVGIVLYHTQAVEKTKVKISETSNEDPRESDEDD